MSTTFFLQPDIKNESNRDFLNTLEAWSNASNRQTYVISRPLGDARYSYSNGTALAILVPKCRLVFVDFGADKDSFEEYIDDFVEDLGSISDKYRYKDVIGRPRQWRQEFIVRGDSADSPIDLVNSAWIEHPGQQRVAELLISLLIGSINDADAVRADVPEILLEKVKRKILLFDGDQTRFVYNQPSKPEIRIQGLSGTGKTELLLHKLKDLYVQDSISRIAFTCHNKVLADSLKRRIPDFFNFMKVEQQIKWNERLWCVHAWGSHNNPSSGIYRYICDFYKIQFYSYSKFMTFEAVCSSALKQLEAREDRSFAFDYMFIDESQDFPESFFDLCKAATKSTVYIAGDIFQSIFDERVVTEIQPDFLLSKCYRTDPRTLMFAHAIGMGLFEEKKLRWLDDNEWQACGYIVERDNGTDTILKREPLRRFEDLGNDMASVEIIRVPGIFYANAPTQIIEIIKTIRNENPTVTPEDIGVILVDVSNEAFSLADALEQLVPRHMGWTVNKAYESKRKDKDSLFISNKNNVKGLEFPFVICVTERIASTHAYRNALYMTLTRSFLKTYMVISDIANQAIVPPIITGLTHINETGTIRARTPTELEKQGIRTTINYTDTSMSFYDFAEKIFDELEILPIFRQNLLDVLQRIVGEDFDYEKVKEVAAYNYSMMNGGD
jgi:superfamily I DNA and RNA helicase